jgi:hypothetical protein
VGRVKAGVYDTRGLVASVATTQEHPTPNTPTPQHTCACLRVRPVQLGGLAGAAMVVVNTRITALRRRFIPATRPLRRVAEVVALSLLTGGAWVLLSLLSPCKPTPSGIQPGSSW